MCRHFVPRRLKMGEPGRFMCCCIYHEIINHWRVDEICSQAKILLPNSTLSMSKPMTISCINSRFEKQIVLPARRLILVLKFWFLCSIFWVLRLPTHVCQPLDGTYTSPVMRVTGCGLMDQRIWAADPPSLRLPNTSIPVCKWRIIPKVEGCFNFRRYKMD